jgi:hypothetical protein
MSRMKLLTVIVIILVILNVTIVSLMAFQNFPHPHHPPHMGRPLFEVIEDKLELDQRQKAEFKKLREAHHEQMVELEKKRNRLLKEYFKTLDQLDGQEKIVNDLMNELKKIEQQRIDITYAHFKDVKALCHEDQLKEFPEVLDIAIDHLLGSAKKGPPPPLR